MNGLVRFTFCRSAATILSYMLWQFALFQRLFLSFPDETCQEKERSRGIRYFYDTGRKTGTILIGEIKNLFDFMLKLFQRISSNIEGRLLKRLNLKEKYMN